METFEVYVGDRTNRTKRSYPGKDKVGRRTQGLIFNLGLQNTRKKVLFLLSSLVWQPDTPKDFLISSVASKPNGS